jgi:hypothetical protein
MACECEDLERALDAMRTAAAVLERDYISRALSPSIRARLARAHAFTACDELESALAEHRRERCSCGCLARPTPPAACVRGAA